MRLPAPRLGREGNTSAETNAMRIADLSPHQRREIDVAIRAAETATRYEISIYIGPSAADLTRDFAEDLHARMAAPDRSVLIMLDPTARAIEIVTGQYVRRTLPDEAAQRAVKVLGDALAERGLVEGVVFGLGELVDAADVYATG